MKYLLMIITLLGLGAACSSPEEKYQEQQVEAETEYQEDMREAEDEYQDVQKEEAIDYVEESEGVDVKRDENRIEVEE